MSFLGTLKTINRKLGNPAKALGPVREAIEPRMRMIKWESDRRERARKRPDSAFSFDRQDKTVQEIERDGFAIVRNALDKQLLLDVLREAEAHLDAGTSLVPISRDSARQKGDLAAAGKH